MKFKKISLFPDEIIFIKKNYDTMTYNDILNHLNSFRNCVNKLRYSTLRHRFRELGLYRYHMKYWNKSQERYLLENWKIKGNKEMAIHLSSGKFYGKKNITAGKVRKKMELFDLHRTPKELSTVVKRNIQLGYTYVNKPGNAVVKGSPEGHMSIQKCGDGKPYNFIKINGYYRMYGKWWYEKNIGPIPKGFILHRADMDSLNDDPDNLKLKRRSWITVREMEIAIDLTKLCISHLNIDLGKITHSFRNNVKRADLRCKLRRLRRHERDIIQKLNKRISK